ncbi:MAG: amidohydrolase family protein [Bacteroidetes bacterium]|nr:amidohydrolase family protein [Bacteroidota bacterium]
MKILLKKASILDEASPFNGKKLDILIENGRISDIKNEIHCEKATQVSSPNLHVSLGWVDLKSAFGDPGFEHKETIESGLDTAAAGGYTHICTLPKTSPVCDNKTLIDYQLVKAANHAVKLHPMGAITKGMRGEELAEMFDMMQAGARLFTDDTNPLQTGMLQRTLLYSKNLSATICLAARDHDLSRNTQVHEGISSTRTGMKADPAISEIIQLEKIIRMLEYTETHAHISGISTKEGVEIVKNAKKQGLMLTCDVNIMNVLYSENNVLNFDNLMKVLPVLRSNSDREHILAGIMDGTIDAITSDHRPVDAEEKELEFDCAAFGCYQLQTVFSSLNSYSGIPLEKIVRILSFNARKVAMIDSIPIDFGNSVDLTVFDPSKKWIYSKENNLSRHAYSPHLNKEFTGKVLGVIRNTNAVFTK